MEFLLEPAVGVLPGTDAALLEADGEAEEEAGVGVLDAALLTGGTALVTLGDDTAAVTGEAAPKTVPETVAGAAECLVDDETTGEAGDDDAAEDSTADGEDDVCATGATGGVGEAIEGATEATAGDSAAAATGGASGSAVTELAAKYEAAASETAWLAFS